MRLSHIISFLVTVSCLNTFHSVFGKNEKAASKRGESPTFARSGQFSTKHQHQCTWEIAGDLTISLSISCNEQNSSNYKCTYEGEPQKCPSYNVKAKQYWKQILGKFKKMKNACQEKLLKSRICKKTAAVESQLLKVGGDKEEGPEQGKAEGKSRAQESRKGPEERPHLTDVDENVGAEKKSNAKKRKPSSKPTEKAGPASPTSLPEMLPTAREVNDDIVELNEDLAEAYCAENWHSVCSFFVNFWNG
ncbi:fibroblast growth factor-binding protein 3 [Pelodytes ibericus]